MGCLAGILGCKGVRIRVCDDLTAVPARYRSEALLGYASVPAHDTASSEHASYLNYAKKNAEKLAEMAIDHSALLTFLCENRLIEAKDYEAYMNEAEKRGSAEQKALLLNYRKELEG